MNKIPELALECIVYAEIFKSISTQWGTYDESGRPKWEDEFVKQIMNLSREWVILHTKLKYLNKHCPAPKEMSSNIPFSILYYFHEPAKSYEEYVPKLEEYILNLEKML